MTLPGIFGWKENWFKWDYFHAESTGNLNFKNVPEFAKKDDLECSWICLKTKNCSGFSVEIENNFCAIFDGSALVKVTKNNMHAIKAYKSMNSPSSKSKKFESILNQFWVNFG